MCTLFINAVGEDIGMLLCTSNDDDADDVDLKSGAIMFSIVNGCFSPDVLFGTLVDTVDTADMTVIFDVGGDTAHSSETRDIAVGTTGKANVDTADKGSADSIGTW